MKPIFQRSPTLTLRLIVFATLSIVLMTLEHHGDDIPRVRSFFNELLYPIHLMVDLPTSLVKDVNEVLASRSQLMRENRQLREETLALQVELQKLKLLEAENERLQSLLSSAKRVKQRVSIAQMLAVDLDPYRHNVLINKGRKHGVYIGQPIIDAHGIMGQITEVSASSSIALLLSDPSHSIPVKVVRNGLRTIATGTGNPNSIRLDYIPGSGDIEVGDVLVSSGLGGRYPVDFPVATVATISRSTGKPFAEVRARPIAEIDRSQEVLLVWLEDAESTPVIEESAQNSHSPWPLIDILAMQTITTAHSDYGSP